MWPNISLRDKKWFEQQSREYDQRRYAIIGPEREDQNYCRECKHFTGYGSEVCETCYSRDKWEQA